MRSKAKYAKRTPRQQGRILLQLSQDDTVEEISVTDGDIERSTHCQDDKERFCNEVYF